MLNVIECDLISSMVYERNFVNVNEKEITRNNSFKNIGNVKPIKDFPHYYISDEGKVYSDIKGKTVELKPWKNRGGYLLVNLYKDCKIYHKSIHRLVLETFTPIADMDKYDGNHINELKTDNRLCNLNWLTRKENCNWGTRNERAGKALSANKERARAISKAKIGIKLSPSHREAISKAKKGKKPTLNCVIAGIKANSKKVLQYDTSYNLIASYSSAKEAAKAFGVNHSTISNYCHNLKLFRGKYYLQYEN